MSKWRRTNKHAAFEATTFTAVGELLSCDREATNTRDRYAVVVKKDGEAIGHLPRKELHVCSLFLRRGGTL